MNEKPEIVQRLRDNGFKQLAERVERAMHTAPSTEKLIAAVWDSNIPTHYAQEIQRRLLEGDQLNA